MTSAAKERSATQIVKMVDAIPAIMQVPFRQNRRTGRPFAGRPVLPNRARRHGVTSALSAAGRT
jgi:hypothetical protein